MARSDEVLQALRASKAALTVVRTADYESFRRAADALEELCPDDFSGEDNKGIFSGLTESAEKISTGCYALVDSNLMVDRINTLIARMSVGRA